MIKKVTLILALILISSAVCHAQSNETLGDKAMASGNYNMAVEYYMAAMNQHPTNALSDKLSKATMLKNEFKAIDEAIANRNAAELEFHINNVLVIDPNNKFIKAKQSQFSATVSKHKSDNFKEGLLGIFIGDENKSRIHGYISFDQGVGIVTVPNQHVNQGLTMVQRFQFKSYFLIPFVFDFHSQFNALQNHYLWGVGTGSCMFIGNHITLDYGIGLQRNRNNLSFNPYYNHKGYYYRAGLTYMGNNGFGLNYSFNHYWKSGSVTFNTHQFTVSVNPSKNNAARAIGITFITIHVLADIFILKHMYH